MVEDTTQKHIALHRFSQFSIDVANKLTNELTYLLTYLLIINATSTNLKNENIVNIFSSNGLNVLRVIKTSSGNYFN